MAKQINKPQPKITLTRTFTDQVLEALGAAAILAMWILLIYHLPRLPQSIPVHFNGEGKIDGYGNKIILIFEPVIASILYFGLTFLNRYPHLFNYLSAINDDNAEYQYRMATRLIRYIKLIIVLFFIFIMWTSIKAATSLNDGLGMFFLPVFFALIIFPTLVVLIKSSNSQKRSQSN